MFCMALPVIELERAALSGVNMLPAPPPPPSNQAARLRGSLELITCRPTGVSRTPPMTEEGFCNASGLSVWYWSVRGSGVTVPLCWSVLSRLLLVGTWTGITGRLCVGPC